MSKQEKIVCAAVTFYTKDSEYFTCGTDYDHCEDIFTDLVRLKYIDTKHGFITNTNRFVDPKEAMQIAINNNQIRELSKLYTRWIGWQLVKDKRWRDVCERWYDMRDKLKSKELKPEDLY